MTIGKFTAILGSSSDNFLLANNGDIIYGLQGNDNLALNPILTENKAAILVGGSGGDRYTLDDNQFAVVFDNGNSEEDSLIANIDDTNSYFLDIDNRHLYVFDTDSQQYLLLLDWQNPKNRIETFEIDDGQQLSYQELVTGLNNLRGDPNSNYLGNYTFKQLNDTTQNTVGFPLSEALIDFASYGLSPAAIDDDIQKIADTASNLETRGSIVYRFYNPSAGVHFYTADRNERDYVRNNLDNYDYEGESYATVDPVTGNSPEAVYRFFNSTTGVHLYTTDEKERDYIIDNLSNFTYEDIKFYAYETQVEGTVPIYRFYEPTIGVHFYTPNEAEKTYIEDNLSNYNYEKIAYSGSQNNEVRQLNFSIMSKSFSFFYFHNFK